DGRDRKLSFIPAMIPTFFYRRIAVVVALTASLARLPLYLYFFTAPGPFRWVQLVRRMLACLRLSPRRPGCYPACYGGSRHLPAGSGVHLPARTLPASARSLARSERGHRPAARSSSVVSRSIGPLALRHRIRFSDPRPPRPRSQRHAPPRSRHTHPR